MPLKGFLSRLTLAAAGLAIAWTFVFATSADAAERTVRPQRPAAAAERRAPRGDFTRRTQRTRNDDGRTRRDEQTNDRGFTRDSTVTLPDGRTATRSAEVTRDRDSGTRTREATTTGPQGQTRTLSDVTQRTEDGFTRSTEITNPNGGSLTRDVTATYDPEINTWVRDVTVDRERVDRERVDHERVDRESVDREKGTRPPEQEP